MSLIGFPFLIVSFCVILGTIVTMVAIVRRQSNLTIEFDNEPVIPESDRNRQWPIIDPLIEFGTSAVSSLPGIHRPIGTVISLLISGITIRLLFHDTSSGNVIGVLLAVLSVWYGDAAAGRGKLKGGGWRRAFLPSLTISIGLILTCAHLLILLTRWGRL
ncbi:hypothetical protein HN588_03600 [Candidatus Bathyarchaeota archaeon]|jgi:hypothetical protein|nr:hypothetical protein [Candidatus Bathyarchaeota archaeon]